MILPGPKLATAIAAIVLFGGLVFAPASRAQIFQQPAGPNNMANLKASQDQLNVLQNVETHSTIDPKETAAYQKFFAVDPRNADKKSSWERCFWIGTRRAHTSKPWMWG
ncbi:MAG: hypothetical protein WBQ34_09240 [Candidatus Acidiferrales bacterium]